jgi:hypothetical protein
VLVSSIGDVLTLSAKLRESLDITPATGHLAQWAATRACDGDGSESGAGHDFAMSANNRWGVAKVRSPQGLLPRAGLDVPHVASYEEIVATLPQRQAQRLAALVTRWQDDDRLWVEVKHHFLQERHLDPDRWYFHDTKGKGGPKDFFAPVADAYVKIFLNPNGSLRSAWLVPHAEIIAYVRKETRRGGAWNYKIAFAHDIPIGMDIAEHVQQALDTPLPDMESR